MSEQEWKNKLSPLVERDLYIREGLQKRGVLADSYHKEMEKVHLENMQKLSQLISKWGFPVLSNAGEESVRLAWLIIHHSISSPPFMKECLLQMKLAGSQHDYPLDLIAYTEDRIAFFEGRPQLYGTNCDWQEGELKPTPIEDVEMVDVRRKSIGLPLIGKFTQSVNEKPPKDPEAKAKEFQAWLLRTGWRF